MRLLGRDFSPVAVLSTIGQNLRARGLAVPPEEATELDEVEARVDPLSFNLDALAEHADATKGLPLETHRGGASGRAVMLAKQAFRSLGQVFINEALGRQVLFNGHVRDSYAQLSAEVLRLRGTVAELQAKLDALEHAPPPPVEAPATTKTAPPKKPSKPSRRKS